MCRCCCICFSCVSVFSLFAVLLLLLLLLLQLLLLSCLVACHVAVAAFSHRSSCCTSAPASSQRSGRGCAIMLSCAVHAILLLLLILLLICGHVSCLFSFSIFFFCYCYWETREM